MLARSGQPFDSSDWLFEIKYDGTRAILFAGKGILLQNRRLSDITYRYPEIAAMRDSIKAKDAVLDGEIVVFRGSKPDFQLLQTREHQQDPLRISLLSKRYPATYIAFDILRLDRKDLTKRPLIERKKALRKVLRESPNIIYSEFVRGKGGAFFAAVKKAGLEGVMAKRIDSRYEQGKRSESWLKIKAVKTQDCVVCGYTLGEGARAGYFGALLLGCYSKKGLTYVGRVGSGFDRAALKNIRTMMKHYETPRCPFAINPEPGLIITWLKPQLVCEVKYQQLTQDGKLRAPVFLRMRNDKEPKECVI